jgi:hypothetical protein
LCCQRRPQFGGIAELDSIGRLGDRAGGVGEAGDGVPAVLGIFAAGLGHQRARVDDVHDRFPAPVIVEPGLLGPAGEQVRGGGGQVTDAQRIAHQQGLGALAQGIDPATEGGLRLCQGGLQRGGVGTGTGVGLSQRRYQYPELVQAHA